MRVRRGSKSISAQEVWPRLPLTLQHYERGVSRNTAELHAVTNVERRNDKDKDKGVNYALDSRPEGKAEAYTKRTGGESILMGAKAAAAMAHRE